MSTYMNKDNNEDPFLEPPALSPLVADNSSNFTRNDGYCNVKESFSVSMDKSQKESLFNCIKDQTKLNAITTIKSTQNSSNTHANPSSEMNHLNLSNNSHIDASYSCVMEYYPGMHLLPGTLINIPLSMIDPNFMTHSQLTTVPNDDTTTMHVVGLAINSQTVIPLNTDIPFLDINSLKYMQKNGLFSCQSNKNSQSTTISNITESNITNTSESIYQKNVTINMVDSIKDSFSLSSCKNISKNTIMKPLPPLRITSTIKPLPKLEKNDSNLNSTDSKSSFIVKGDRLKCENIVSKNGFKCMICGISYNAIDDLKMHLSLHQKNLIGNDHSTVNSCTLEMKSQCSLLSNQNHAVNNDKNIKSCKLCGHSLRTVSVFHDIINEFSGDSNKNISSTIDVCDNCGKEHVSPTLSIDADKMHTSRDLNVNHQKKPRTNNIVKNSHIVRNFLPNITNHHNERYFCRRCERSYKHNRDLRKHEKIVHGLQIQQLSKVSRDRTKNLDKMNNNDNHETEFKNTISDSTPCTNEIQTTTPTPIVSMIPSITKTVFDAVNAETSCRDHLDKSNQYEKFFCDQCSKTFRGPFELRRHILTIHENKKPYKCQICGKYFRDTYEVKRHNISQHKNFYTNVEFNENSTSADNHLVVDCVSQANIQKLNDNCLNKTHLFNELSSSNDLLIKNSLCNYKNEPFLTNSMISSNSTSSVINNCNNKMLVKSGRPFNETKKTTTTTTSSHLSIRTTNYFCGICEKNFRGSNEFKRHYSVVHEKKYRYKCIHCGKLWRDQYDLKRHCRRSHFLGRDIDKAYIRQCLLLDNISKNNSNDSNIDSGSSNIKLDTIIQKKRINDNTTISIKTDMPSSQKTFLHSTCNDDDSYSFTNTCGSGKSKQIDSTFHKKNLNDQKVNNSNTEYSFYVDDNVPAVSNQIDNCPSIVLNNSCHKDHHDTTIGNSCNLNVSTKNNSLYKSFSDYNKY